MAATYGRRVDSVDEWIVKENIASMDCEFPSDFLLYFLF